MLKHSSDKLRVSFASAPQEKQTELEYQKVHTGGGDSLRVRNNLTFWMPTSYEICPFFFLFRSHNNIFSSKVARFTVACPQSSKLQSIVRTELSYMYQFTGI